MSEPAVRNSDNKEVVDGTVYGLFPESSRRLYEECIADLAAERKVKISSSLDTKVTDIAEQVWKKIRTAEVVMADITGFDLQVVCEIGMARGLKDSKKLILLCSREAFEDQESKLPLDLRSLDIQLYDETNFVQLRQNLAASLNDSLKNRAPVEPIEDLNIRQLVQRAIKNIQGRDFITAEVLFRRADEKLPDHWYIHLQWGVMLREKGDLTEARDYFGKAEQQAEFDENRAEVYIEQAILEFRDKEASRAEGLFERARSIDKKNRRLYIVWADIMDQLGVPVKALGCVAALMEAVGTDDETTLLTQYYSNRLANPAFTMSLEEFKKQRQVVETRSPRRDPPPARPEGRPARPPSGPRKSIPNKISWTEFKRDFTGARVEGVVKNAHPGFGVFVYLGDFKGLIHKQHLGDGFASEYNQGDRVTVWIRSCYLLPDQKQAIELVPA